MLSSNVLDVQKYGKIPGNNNLNGLQVKSVTLTIVDVFQVCTYQTLSKHIVNLEFEMYSENEETTCVLYRTVRVLTT